MKLKSILKPLIEARYLVTNDTANYETVKLDYLAGQEEFLQALTTIEKWYECTVDFISINRAYNLIEIVVH